jgi:hypothetical protein
MQLLTCMSFCIYFTQYNEFRQVLFVIYKMGEICTQCIIKDFTGTNTKYQISKNNKRTEAAARPLKNFISEKISTIYSADFLCYLLYMVVLNTISADFRRFSVASPQPRFFLKIYCIFFVESFTLFRTNSIFR